MTGHTSTRGLDAYDEGDENQQRMLSNIIDGVGQSTKTSSTSAALLSPAPLSTANKSQSLSINDQSAITPQSQDQGINPLQPSVRPWPVQSCVSSSAQQSNFHFPAVPSGGYNFMQLPFFLSSLSKKSTDACWACCSELPELHGKYFFGSTTAITSKEATGRKSK